MEVGLLVLEEKIYRIWWSDGGDGGNGGAIILESERNLNTLIDLGILSTSKLNLARLVVKK